MIAGVGGIGRKSLDLASVVSQLMGIFIINTLKLIGSLLETNLSKAVEMSAKQRKAATDFSGTFPKKTIESWKKMVKQWQEDPSRPNPYVSNERGMYFEEIDGCVTHDHFTSIENIGGSVAVG